MGPRWYYAFLATAFFAVAFLREAAFFLVAFFFFFAAAFFFVVAFFFFLAVFLAPPVRLANSKPWRPFSLMKSVPRESRTHYLDGLRGYIGSWIRSCAFLERFGF